MREESAPCAGWAGANRSSGGGAWSWRGRATSPTCAWWPSTSSARPPTALRGTCNTLGYTQFTHVRATATDLRVMAAKAVSAIILAERAALCVSMMRDHEYGPRWELSAADTVCDLPVGPCGSDKFCWNCEELLTLLQHEEACLRCIRCRLCCSVLVCAHAAGITYASCTHHSFCAL